jgi:hypothetical protein
VGEWAAGIGRPIYSPIAKTRSWKKAEEFKRELEAEYDAKQSGAREVVNVAPKKMSVKDTDTSCNSELVLGQSFGWEGTGRECRDSRALRSTREEQRVLPDAVGVTTTTFL